MAHVVFEDKASVAKALKMAAASTEPGAELPVLPLPAADAYGMQRALRGRCSF